MTTRFQVDEPAVWSELGHAQLDNGLVAEAIASYLRSNDTSRSSDVIERSKEVRLAALSDCNATSFAAPVHSHSEYFHYRDLSTMQHLVGSQAA